MADLIDPKGETMRRSLILGVCALGAILVLTLRADEPAAKRAGNAVLASIDSGSSTMRAVLERHATDLSSLERFHRIPLSPERAKRMKRFHEDWLAALGDVDFR